MFSALSHNSIIAVFLIVYESHRSVTIPKSQIRYHVLWVRLETFWIQAKNKQHLNNNNYNNNCLYGGFRLLVLSYIYAVFCENMKK